MALLYIPDSHRRSVNDTEQNTKHTFLVFSDGPRGGGGGGGGGGESISLHHFATKEPMTVRLRG